MLVGKSSHLSQPDSGAQSIPPLALRRLIASVGAGDARTAFAAALKAVRGASGIRSPRARIVEKGRLKGGIFPQIATNGRETAAGNTENDRLANVPNSKSGYFLGKRSRLAVHRGNLELNNSIEIRSLIAIIDKDAGFESLPYFVFLALTLALMVSARESQASPSKPPGQQGRSSFAHMPRYPVPESYKAATRQRHEVYSRLLSQLHGHAQRELESEERAWNHDRHRICAKTTNYGCATTLTEIRA